MAKHLDLEEQEQLDSLKHFWKTYGNLIVWAAMVVFGAMAAWNGWQYWQRAQSVKASALYDEVERAASAGEMSRLERSLADMKDKFPGTTYAQQASLLAARAFHDKGQPDAAKAALLWVAEKSGDEALSAVARLRLASLHVQANAYDQALAQLAVAFPVEFQALVADRKGDIYLLQGKRAQARDEFSKAYQAFEETSEYRRMVEAKLNALGLDPRPAPNAPPTAGAKP
jgi:predicted negative regulator of RcsB-dependent stress response